MGAAEARVQRVRGRHKQLVTDITDNLRNIPAAAYTASLVTALVTVQGGMLLMKRCGWGEEIRTSYNKDDIQSQLQHYSPFSDLSQTLTSLPGLRVD